MKGLIAIAGTAILATAFAASAQDRTRVIETCPPDLDYCIRVVKPILSPVEVLIKEAREAAELRERLAADEKRKLKERAVAGYRDPPGTVEWCAPASVYRMSNLHGCYPIRRLASY